jgi:hypothetical protein
MLTISTKELRNNFPIVLAKLAQGKTFLLIHRSHPVAEIKKPETIFSFDEATEKDIETASVQDVGEDFLSKKELDYYLSLK